MIEALNREGRIHGGYGILESDDTEFESFLGRSLLWARGSEENAMERIRPLPIAIPSWSWMAYKGAIDYMDPPFGEVVWTTDKIKSPWIKGSQAPVWQTLTGGSEGTKLNVIAMSVSISQARGDNVVFDDSMKTPTEGLKCVLIGYSNYGNWPKNTFYVLIISRLDDLTWERAGVGALRGESIEFKDADSVCVV